MGNIKKVDIISINDQEARQLTGEHSLVNAAKLIHQLGPKYVIIKKGEHGALLFHGNEVFSVPALPLAEVFDPTGAGDSFAAGFLHGYINNYPLDKCAEVGNFCASETVKVIGARPEVNVKEMLLKNNIL